MTSPVSLKGTKRRPITARRVLKRLWAKVRVYSCADGTFRIEPKWRKQYNKPGVLTRMYAANQIEEVIRGNG